VTGAVDATTANVWAHELKVAGNLVRQLLVPESGLEIVDGDAGLHVASEYGQWPALRGTDCGVDAPLTARLPTLARSRTRVTWSGSRDLLEPASVTRSYVSAIGFRSPDEPGSLRRPQLGALHSALGYWTSGLIELAPQLRPRFHTVIAQPGLSAAAATDEQLRLIAGAENYVRAVTRGTFEVRCSP